VLAYSDFLAHVENNEVREVVMRGSQVSGAFTDGTAFSTYIPRGEKTLDLLLTKKIEIEVRPPDDAPSLISVLVGWLPLFLLFGALWYFINRPLVRIERRLQQLEQAIPRQQNSDRE